MAIEKEQITELFNGEGELDQKIDTLMALYKDDVDAQLNAIKLNAQKIKEEKTEEIAKKHAAEKERNQIKIQLEQEIEEIKKIGSKVKLFAQSVPTDSKVDLVAEVSK